MTQTNHGHTLGEWRLHRFLSGTCCHIFCRWQWIFCLLCGLVFCPLTRRVSYKKQEWFTLRGRLWYPPSPDYLVGSMRLVSCVVCFFYNIFACLSLFCDLWHILMVSHDCPFFIVPWIFADVYLADIMVIPVVWPIYVGFNLSR